jgi:calcineurin-like phosphoesterase family protein
MSEQHPEFKSEDCVFISDTHFGHANIIKYCERPFEFPHTAEMDALMLNGIQQADEAGKTIFHMGDFVFNPVNLLNTKWRPKGDHYIILGNHDKHADADGKYRKLYREFFTHIIGHSKHWRLNTFNINLDDRRIVLSHEPQQHLGWAQYNIYGHHHNNMIRNTDRFRFDEYDWLYGKDTHFNAGVELTNYRPVTYDELVEIPRPVKPT